MHRLVKQCRRLTDAPVQVQGIQPMDGCAAARIYSAEKITVVGTVKRDRSIFLQSTGLIASVVVMPAQRFRRLECHPRHTFRLDRKVLLFHPGATV
jgi:hypothetical protein